jgi:hypothetical protein
MYIAAVFIYLSEKDRFKDVDNNSASFTAKLNWPSDSCTNFTRTKTGHKKQATWTMYKITKSEF